MWTSHTKRFQKLLQSCWRSGAELTNQLRITNLWTTSRSKKIDLRKSVRKHLFDYLRFERLVLWFLGPDNDVVALTPAWLPGYPNNTVAAHPPPQSEEAAPFDTLRWTTHSTPFQASLRSCEADGVAQSLPTSCGLHICRLREDLWIFPRCAQTNRTRFTNQ